MGVAGKCGRKSKYGKGVKTKTISIRVPVEMHDRIKLFLNDMVKLEIEKQNAKSTKQTNG